MSNLRQAAQQALEAMDHLHRTGDTQVFDLCHRETTEALRAALAEPEQEPLTDEEIEQAYRHIYHNVPDGSYRTTYYWIEQGIRYAEQAHGIKGEA